MFEGGYHGKIIHINGTLGTGFDFIKCPNVCLNVQHFITENNVAMVPQPVVPPPSSFRLLPVPNDENPVSGTTIQGYCGDSCTLGSAGLYHETEIPPDTLPAARKALGPVPTHN